MLPKQKVVGSTPIARSKNNIADPEVPTLSRLGKTVTPKDTIGPIHLDRILLGRWPTRRAMQRDIYWLNVFDRDVESRITERAQTDG